MGGVLLDLFQRLLTTVPTTAITENHSWYAESNAQRCSGQPSKPVSVRSQHSNLRWSIDEFFPAVDCDNGEIWNRDGSPISTAGLIN